MGRRMTPIFLSDKKFLGILRRELNYFLSPAVKYFLYALPKDHQCVRTKFTKILSDSANC